MVNRPFLVRKHDARRHRQVIGKPTLAKLLDMVHDQIIARFDQISRTNIPALAIAVSEPTEAHSVRNPCHPACMEFASSSYCRESWQGYLVRLKHRPEIHWGTCQYQRTCAMIPIACQNRCLAVIKLVAPASEDNSNFKQAVDIMELLVRDFAATHADFLKRMPGGINGNETAKACAQSAAGREKNTPSSTHPQVLGALEYIDANLSHPHLTVAGIASVLGVNPTYLSELFVEQMGQRMSWFIAARRVEKARKLLDDTDWQVKRIALETGFANPNWFCHVFRAHAGLTPGRYRASARTQR